MKQQRNLAIVLLVVMWMSALACAPAAKQTEATTAQTTVAPVVVLPTETAQPEAMQDPTPEPVAQSWNAEEKVAGMLPVLDSLVRAIGVQGEVSYAPGDGEFFWSVLYLMGENWGSSHPLVTRNGDIVVVPRSAMEEFAAAAFSAYKELLPVPDSFEQSVRYDQAQDAYLLSPSDMGATNVNIQRYTLEPDGYTAEAVLYNVDERIGSLEFTMADNPYAADIDAPQYLLSVTGATRYGDDGPAWQTVALGKSLQVDLDGDGTEETISVQVGKEDSATLTVVSNGKKQQDFQEYFYMADCHVGDADGSDGSKELYLCGDTGSDDYITYQYRLVDGELIRQELNGKVLFINENGEISLETVVDLLGSYGARTTYRFSNDAFTPASGYTIYKSIGAWQQMPLETKKEGLPVTLEATGVQTLLPAGTKLLPVETDRATYVTCEQEDGSLVKVEVARKDGDEWGWNIAGISEDEWFVMVPYAG